jgi:hypothetical protein
MTITVIKQPTLSKNKIRKEKRAQNKKEMNQLTELTSVKPVFLNSVKDPRVPHKVELKEERLDEILTLHSMNQQANPERFKTKGLGNSPRTKWDYNQTAFEVQKDKYTCSSIADYEKKNKWYSFNHGEDMPIKRKSALSGVTRPDADFLMKSREKAEAFKKGEKYTEVDEIDIRMGGKLEENKKLELK